MPPKTAEIIAIGDELVSGQRLDTNSQWISGQLGELGVETRFHACVGDNLEEMQAAFHTAIGRSDFVICTGGIGPTKDDLTREVIAKVAGVELEYNADAEQHIRSIFQSYGREMPENNRVQAYFPVGSQIIENPEGTAPGIDLEVGSARVFALPGVPYEMKQMWADHVTAALAGNSRLQVMRHHVVHCFGAGESQVELMLDGMTARDHVPCVGITASQATISLRISARGETEEACEEQIRQTTDKIDQRLGQLVFGENGTELEDVVVERFRELKLKAAIHDYAFGGAAGLLLLNADARKESETIVCSNASRFDSFPQHQSVAELAEQLRDQHAVDVAIVISPLIKTDEGEVYDVAIVREDSTDCSTHKYAGHSGLREARTVKQILNQMRLAFA